MKTEVERFTDYEALSCAAADTVCVAAKNGVKARGHFALALSGGRTPRRLYELLAESPWCRWMPWPQTHLFWGDERRVPREHPEGNFRLARDTFLTQVPITPKNIHPMPVELSSPQAVSEAYETELRRFFEPRKETFDLILLGVGVDGHTASLFPRDPALRERKRRVLAIENPQGNPKLPRLTLSLPAINSSRRALLLATGEEKKPLVDTIMQKTASRTEGFPAMQVAPRERASWFWAPK